MKNYEKFPNQLGIPPDDQRLLPAEKLYLRTKEKIFDLRRKKVLLSRKPDRSRDPYTFQSKRSSCLFPGRVANYPPSSRFEISIKTGFMPPFPSTSFLLWRLIN